MELQLKLRPMATEIRISTRYKLYWAVWHSLRKLFANTDIRVVAEAKTGAEAMKLATKHKPDVVLLDVCMDGLEAIEKIRRGSRETKVVMFSNHDNPVFGTR